MNDPKWGVEARHWGTTWLDVVAFYLTMALILVALAAAVAKIVGVL